MGERVSDFEKLGLQKTSDCNTVWKQEDDKIIKSLAKSLTKKKWDIIKLCLETMQEISITVKEMKIPELKKMGVDWNEDDARKLEMIRIKNIRYLSLRSSKLKIVTKENILRNFCETKGYKKEKEDWRKKVDKELELKETIMKNLVVKKKMAKSKKKRLELLMECKRTLQDLIVDWNDTPVLDEEKMTRIIRESWMKEKNMLPTRVKFDFTTSPTTVRDTCWEVQNVTNAEKIDLKKVNSVRDDCPSDNDNKGDDKKREEQEKDFKENSKVKNRSSNSHTQSSASPGKTKPHRKAKTTKGSPVRQELKEALNLNLNIIPARVSRQIVEKSITKPQQMYRSMKISGQTSSST